MRFSMMLRSTGELECTSYVRPVSESEDVCRAVNTRGQVPAGDVVGGISQERRRCTVLGSENWRLGLGC